MLEGYADDAVGRLDLIRSPGAFQTWKRRVLAAAKAATVPAGPRPWDARIAPRKPGQEERKAIVGAILDFPCLLDDPEVVGSLDVLEGASARIVAEVRGCMRTNARGEKALDSAVFLAQMPDALQTFAAARLAAPAHETLSDARATLIDNADKLRRSLLSREVIEIAREQERTAGDWDHEAERAREAQALAREKHKVKGRAK
jgi:hypothetical protein